MISLVLLLILSWQFYIGYSRGILLQVYYFVANIISLIVASQSYQTLAKKIMLWVPYANASRGASVYFFKTVNLFDLDRVYYAGVAFTIIYVIMYLLFRLIGVVVHLAQVNRFDNVKMNCISGVLSILVTLTFFHLILATLATVPMPAIQNSLSGSFLARVIINFLPPLSNIIKALWFSTI